MASRDQIDHAGDSGRPSRRSAPNLPTAIRRYSLAVVSVALALLLTLLLQHYEFRHTILALFLFAIAVTAWYAGVGPARLSILLSILCFDYFFAPPVYSFAFTAADVPAILVLVSFGVVIIRFSAFRRRVEGQLLQAHDELQTDIDERKKTEEKLRRSEAYLAEAERLSKTASWAWSPVTRQQLYWSEEMFRIFEFDPRQGIPPAETFWDRVHPEDRDSIFQLMRKAVHEKKDYEHEHRIVLPNGTIKYIHVLGRPVLGSSGDVIEYVGTLVDVTDRKRAEAELREREAFLAEAQKLTHTGSGAWRVAGDDALYLSEEWYRIYGFDPKQGLSAWKERLERMHPEDQAKVKAAKDRAIREKSDYQVEHRILLPDGTVKHTHTVGHPILNASGEVDQFVYTMMDITERKHAEQALQRSESYLAEAQRLTKTGSWAWDPIADKVLYWSEEMFRIFAFDPREGVPVGPKFGQRIHPDEHDRVDEYVRKSVSQKRDYRVSHRIVLPDGTVRHIETIGHPVLNSTGEVVEYVGTAVDITEHKRAETERERLDQLEAYLDRVNRVSMMGELAASLAHEIKQPIAAAATNAKTSLRWIQRERPDLGEASEAVSRVVKDVIRAAEIIDRNCSLYRRDAPKREILNLNELIREMTALLRDAADRHSISIRAELDEALPAMSADRVQMQQVLMNLMLNGIEAMRDTSGQLTIRSTKSEDGQILLSVSDSGNGLPVDNVERVFDAFFTTKDQGTGMGLSISRRIIEAHGGRLWATSNSGQGATFHFTMPAEVQAVETTLERTGS